MRPAGSTRDRAGAVNAVSGSAGSLAGKDFHGQPAGKDAGAPRFMGSLLSRLRMHWDHEPLRLTEARSGARVCDPQQDRFMESRGLLDS